MNKYEVMFIVKPAEEEATNAVIEKVEALIARVGGTVEKVDRWGKRRLAYAVKKFTDGFYVLINFEAAPAEIKEIDRVLKINDEVRRHLLVKHEAYLKPGGKHELCTNSR